MLKARLIYKMQILCAKCVPSIPKLAKPKETEMN